MYARDEPRRIWGGNRPENGVCTSHGNTCGHQHGEAGGQPRTNLSCCKQGKDRQQKPFRFHVAYSQHKRHKVFQGNRWQHKGLLLLLLNKRFPLY